MNTVDPEDEPITVSGKALTYRIKRYKNESEGCDWITVSQSNTSGALCGFVHIDPDQISAICAALKNIGQKPRSESSARKPRNLPNDLGHLRERRAGERWGTGEDGLMVHLYLEGYGFDEIAIRLGRTRNAITSRLRQRGFPVDVDF